MSRKLAIPLFFTFITVFLAPSTVRAQGTPQVLSFCDLATSPKSFDGKMIRVRGTLSVYFEDFSLVGDHCDAHQGIWLAFGGDVPGIAPSTANDNFRKPNVDVKVSGASYGIKKDENFRRLYALIAARHGDKPVFRVTATLTGAFFAGEEHKLPNGQSDFEGYGHLGCCSLLVITEVSYVESVPSANLNIRGTVIDPDGRPVKGFVVFDDVLGGSPPERQHTSTDEKGNFEFSDSGQLLRFENPSYRPLALPVEPGGARVRVKLEDAKRSDWMIPPCGELKEVAGRIGFSVQFALPTTMQSRPFDEDDFSYFVSSCGGAPDTAEPDLFISTIPDQEPKEQIDFVDSKWSEQRWIKDSSGAVIGIDAKGRLKRGGSWRKVFFWRGDFAGYDERGLRAKSPISVLDAIINSACIGER